MLRRIRAAFKLTNAKKYLQRRAAELAWVQDIHGTNHTEEIENLKRAAYICWALEWRV